MIRLFSYIFALILVPFAFGQTNLDAVLKQTLPGNVKMGISVSDLKHLRPDLNEGPIARVQAVGQEFKAFPIYLESINLGTDQASAYWYLIQDDTLVGCLNIRNVSLVVSKEELSKRVTRAYGPLLQAYGDPEEEVAVRGGSNGFVKLKLNRWRIPEVGSVFFMATNQEITTGFIQLNSFPENSVFLKPNPEKFPNDSYDNSPVASVVDIERPSKESILSTIQEYPKSLEEPTKSLVIEEPSPASSDNTPVNSTPFLKPAQYMWGILLLTLIGLVMIIRVFKSEKEGK
jgi:hypothetical protein